MLVNWKIASVRERPADRQPPDYRKLVIDLVRLPGAGQLRGSQKYRGIGW